MIYSFFFFTYLTYDHNNDLTYIVDIAIII